MFYIFRYRKNNIRGRRRWFVVGCGCGYRRWKILVLSFRDGSLSGSGNRPYIAQSSSFSRRNDKTISDGWRLIGRVDDAVVTAAGGGFIGDRQLDFAGDGIDVLLNSVDMRGPSYLIL